MVYALIWPVSVQLVIASVLFQVAKNAAAARGAKDATGDKVSVAWYTATWCGPCKAIAPTGSGEGHIFIFGFIRKKKGNLQVFLGLFCLNFYSHVLIIDVSLVVVLADGTKNSYSKIDIALRHSWLSGVFLKELLILVLVEGTRSGFSQRGIFEHILYFSKMCVSMIPSFFLVPQVDKFVKEYPAVDFVKIDIDEFGGKKALL